MIVIDLVEWKNDGAASATNTTPPRPKRDANLSKVSEPSLMCKGNPIRELLSPTV